ncbi:MAG: hypothetical protein JXQ87_02445 [Bacteroidia bacterium]
MKNVGEVVIRSIIRDQRIVLECEDMSGFLEKGFWLEFQLNGRKVSSEVIALESILTVSGVRKGPIVSIKVDSDFDKNELRDLKTPLRAIVKKLT